MAAWEIIIAAGIVAATIFDGLVYYGVLKQRLDD